MKGNPAHAWGRRGEDLAQRFLQSKSHIIIGRNYRTLNGSAEADLVTKDGETIVFVEVKTRATAEYGSPDSAIDDSKRRRIVRAADDFLRRGDLMDAKVRFDVVNVTFQEKETVQHVQDAFNRKL